MFHRILTFIVALLFLIDSLLLLALGGYEAADIFVIADSPIITAMIILIQLPILYFVVYKAYIHPVQQLNQEIAKFMTGIQDDTALIPDAWSKGMNYVINFFVKSLQILKVFKTELREGRKLKSEIEIASDIQKHVLDKEETVIPSLEIAMWTVAATEVWGDSLDIITGKDGNYYIYVGDVTWHGVPSGLVMMMVNALISAFSMNEVNSAKILAAANKILKPRIKQNMMMTCIMLRWDENTKQMYYTGAGHEHLLVYKDKDQKVYKIKSGWVALGMMRDSSSILKEQQIVFAPDDVIILYTDGISEARYRSEQNGILFGIDRIVDAVVKSENKTAESIFQKITIDLSAFMGYKHKQYDDITLIVVRYLPSGTPGKTIADIAEKIDFSHITEWNWWRKMEEENT